MVTIKDLARMLGLHHTTVSKALRDHPDIKKETREKVKALARELDYHPNLVAQSFKRRTSKTIGVIVPSINVDFFSTVISAIEDVVYDAGYTITISQSNESLQREELNAKTMLASQVAGLIISVSRETKDISHLKSFETYGIPIIFFDRVIADAQAAKVVVDDYHAAFKLVEFMINRGYKDIAHIGATPTVSVSADRRRGYLDALHKHNISPNSVWITEGGFREADGYTHMNAILKSPPWPRAVFAVNDLVAMGAYKAIKNHGIRIPDEMAVAGFGNLQLAEYLDPPLTTVAQEPVKMGQQCAQLLLKAIREPEKSIQSEKSIIPSTLIVRAST